MWKTSLVGVAAVLLSTKECQLFENIRIISGLFLYEKIRHIKFQGLKETIPLAGSLYKIYFQNARNANFLVLNAELKMMKMNAFTPQNFVESQLVIRGIPTNFSEQAVKVNLIERMTRRQENLNGTEGVKYNLIPTETVKVSFDGADYLRRLFCSKSVC